MLLDFAVYILTSVTLSVFLSGLLVWLTKSWISERLKSSIKNEYDQKLETHKAQLKARSDLEVERLRSQLTITATEHEVRFSRLHEKRGEVIAETYSLLSKLFFRMGDYVKIFEPAGDAPKDQRRTFAKEAHQNFRDYYESRLIFFPKATARRLETIDLELVKIFNEFVFVVEMQQGQDTTKNWVSIFERVQNDIKAAIGELEDEFRRILGDESE